MAAASRRVSRSWQARALLASMLLLFSAAGLFLHQLVWLRSTAAQSAGPGLRLRKAGVPASLVRLLAASNEELAVMQSVPPDWSSARLAAFNGDGKPAGPPPPFCTIMLNDDYKIIFLKSPKTATSALLEGYFKECGIQKPESPFCLVWLKVEDPSHVAWVASKWSEYTVFGLTRNILSRSISQYIFSYPNLSSGCPNVTWDDFCRDPYRMGDVCAAAAAGSAGPDCSCDVSPTFHYAHAAPQADCFATMDGLPAVDWLGRVEHLEEDFKSLLTLLNSRPGVPQLPVPTRLQRINRINSTCTSGEQAHAPKAGGRRLAGDPLPARPGTFLPCDKAEYYSGEHAHCAADVLKFYHQDVTFFQRLAFLRQGSGLL